MVDQSEQIILFLLYTNNTNKQIQQMKQTQSLLKNSKISQVGQSQYLQQNLKSSHFKDQQRSIERINSSQKTSLDLKKINLTKNPKDANSSLQFLILLLFKTLKMSLEQILGLFTNQNKYLAHIIVKGVNENFNGIRHFYDQLNQNVQTVKRLFQEDQQDVSACFYAIKPGFISKDQNVAKSTIQFFLHFKSIYEWYISESSKCSNTLLLGFKRHDKLGQFYSNLLFQIIKGKQIDYFMNYYNKSISTPIQFLTVTSKLSKFLSKRTILNSESNEESLAKILQKSGIFQKWLQTAQEVYQSSLEDKLIVIDFLGQFMLWLPEIIEKNQIILNSIRHNWSKYQIITFVPLFNQLLIILQKLANAKSSMSRKFYNIIIDIFSDTYEIEDKRDYIVNGFMTLLSQFPNIPSDLFIRKYQIGKLNSSDFLLICEAIDISNQALNLIKIGDVLKQIFFYDVIANYYLGNLIPEVIKKVIKIESKQTVEFIMNLIKTILSNLVTYVIKSKSLGKNHSQDVYFGKKKGLQKSAKIQMNELTLINKIMDITLNLCEKIIDAILIENVKQNYLMTLKNYFLITNSQIKKCNYGTGNKKFLQILRNKLGMTKQEQVWADEQNKQKLSQSTFRLSESLLSKKARSNSTFIPSLSRIQVPEKVTKQFDQLIAKRKKQQQNREYEEMKKRKEEESKKLLYKKQLEKMNLIKGGFGQGQAQVKEEGFWNRFIKENQELNVYTNDMIEDVFLQAADLIIKNYTKLFKYIFFNYSNSMYSVKNSNFDQNLQKKQTLTAVQIIKFLKDYKLIFITNSQQIQNLVRDINVKIFHRKQIVNELDYEGFEEFIRQFCLCIWCQNKISQKRSYQINHLTLPQLLNDLINQLKNSFKNKGQSLSFFQIAEPQTQYITPEINQINFKIKQNPNYILPQGYKKVLSKKIQYKPTLKNEFKIYQKYQFCIQTLDQIIFSLFQFHIIEPSFQKIIKSIVKPLNSINVRDRDPTKIKSRALSTIIDRKAAVQSSMSKFLTKYDLSKSIKKAMLNLKNEDKIIGQQVGFKLQQMLQKVCQGLDQNDKITNKQITQRQGKKGSSHRRLQSVRVGNDKLQKKIPEDIQKVKKQIVERKRQKQQQQRKREQEEREKMKKKKQIQQKYHQQQRQKLQQKKKNLQEQQRVKNEQLRKGKEEKKKAKQNFEVFQAKQVQKLKQSFSQVLENKKKEEESKEVLQQEQQQKMKKIRAKITNNDKFIAQIRKQTLEGIIEIYFGQTFQSIIKQHQISLRKVFQYLCKQTFNPLTDKKCRQNQIPFQTWLKFNKLFEISPLIVASKDVINIFKAVIKGKSTTKQFLIGLTYQQFIQCLLRQCIKQKTIFTKLKDRIKEEQPVAVQVNSKKNNQKSIAKIQPKNQFEEQQEVDIKKLIKQEDVRDDIIDHYGDLSKFNVQTFKGLIYYLKMPYSKKGQQKRVKELIEMEKEPQITVSNIQKLKLKLKQQYSLQRQKQQQHGKKQEIMKKQEGSKKQQSKKSQGKKSQKLKKQEGLGKQQGNKKQQVIKKEEKGMKIQEKQGKVQEKQGKGQDKNKKQEKEVKGLEKQGKMEEKQGKGQEKQGKKGDKKLQQQSVKQKQASKDRIQVKNKKNQKK